MQDQVIYNFSTRLLVLKKIIAYLDVVVMASKDPRSSLVTAFGHIKTEQAKKMYICALTETPMMIV